MKRIRGKFFGAALGYTFGGPIGALLGAAIGYAVEDDCTRLGAGYTKESQKEIGYVRNLVKFLAGAARADGRVTPEKVETIRRFFGDQLGYRGPHLELIGRLIDESFRQPLDLPAVCAAIAARTAYEERLFLLQLAYRVAASDGLLTPQEEGFIGQGSRLLGVIDYDLALIAQPFTRLRAAGGRGDGAGQEAGSPRSSGGAYDEWTAAGFGGQGSAFSQPLNPYAVLGLAPGCTDADVQKAYRSLAGKYHPDKVSHLGQEFVDLANRKFTMILRAYEEIRRRRGIV